MVLYRTIFFVKGSIGQVRNPRVLYEEFRCKSQERVLAKLEDKLNAFVVAMLDVLITCFIFIFIIS